MTFKRKTKEGSISNQFMAIKWMGILCFFLLFSNPLSAQDSIPLPTDVNEEKEIKFQQFFFKALSEKAIRNFQKAIENLESCHQIVPNDVAVFFEFSKNYYALHQPQLAKAYIEKALEIDPQNPWMRSHLSAILQSNNALEDAIEIQKVLVEEYPREASFAMTLSKLYLQSDQPQEALNFLSQLDQKNQLGTSLRQLKDSLETHASMVEIKAPLTQSASNIELIESMKTYASLKTLLENSKSEAVLLKYSELGIQLFPAQPYIYLVFGTTLNKQQSYQKAISVLKNGLDFVFEDAQEKAFFRELVLSYQGIGKIEEAQKYLKKIEKE